MSSNKSTRHGPSSSSPLPSQSSSKLPRFLQTKARDRSRSVGTMPMPIPDPTGSTSSISTMSASSNSTPETPPIFKTPRRSRLLGLKEKDSSRIINTESVSPSVSLSPVDVPGISTMALAMSREDSMDEPPVIIEPPSTSRSRLRSRAERPSSTGSSDIPSSMYSAPTTRIGDLPSRLSGWFAHTFSSSSTDLPLPSILSQAHLNSPTTPSSSGSPKAKTSALLTAAKHGQGHLNKAVRYLLDSDATPDKCSDPIWLLGVLHPGYEAPSASSPRRSADSRRSSPGPSSLQSSTSSYNELASSQPLSPAVSAQQGLSASTKSNPGLHWPPVFYADFTSRIWLTYRASFSPIRDTNLLALERDAADGLFNVIGLGGVEKGDKIDKGLAISGGGAVVVAEMRGGGSPPTKKWNWPGTGEKGWTSDTGWGCMLRTGQSLLANALLHMNLGRDWRRPPNAELSHEYATYVRIVTWFFDSPSPLAPFSVHRMALAGKDLGKDVGQWFGPSTAAGAIKTLVHGYPRARLGVSVATDSVIFQSDVYAASYGSEEDEDSVLRSLRRERERKTRAWGDRAVLVLIGVRLGLDGVNPIYYETVKALYTFPQSVGIAGGRPSSSYYFVGSQADSLFYLDPHHARPTVPLRPPPHLSYLDRSYERDSTPFDSDRDLEKRKGDRKGSRKLQQQQQHQRMPTSPSSSTKTGSSSLSYHAPMSPSPLQHQYSTGSSSSSSQSSSGIGHGGGGHGRWPTTNVSIDSIGGSLDIIDPPFPSSTSQLSSSQLTTSPAARPIALPVVDPVVEHYCTAYPPSELKTFHCERVRKMPLSGLDPSMLIGFLVKNESDWADFRRRVGKLARDHKTIFSIQDEPPNWPSGSDDDMGLESISEPDDMDFDEEEEEEGRREEEPEEEAEEGEADEDDDDDGEGERFFDSREGGSDEGAEVDEEGGDSGTPGPGSTSFEAQISRSQQKIRNLLRSNERHSFDGRLEEEGGEEESDIEDDWVDPVVPSPSVGDSKKLGVTPSGSPVLVGKELEDEVPREEKERDHEKYRDRDRDRNRDKEENRERDRNGDRDKDRDREREREKAREKERRASESRKHSEDRERRHERESERDRIESDSARRKSRRGTTSQIPVPSASSSTSTTTYPFPSSSSRGADDRRGNSPSPVPPGKGEHVKVASHRMHNARARDGGRTQSGGVKGILAEDL